MTHTYDLGDLLGFGQRRPGDDTRRAMAARRECEAQGHRYRVHGKRTPVKVECGRCRVTWAIGARTEPTS